MSPEAHVLARHRFERAEAACREGDLLADKDAFRGAVNRYYYMVAGGMAIAEILAALPDLVAEDVEEALRCAAATVQDGGRPAGEPQSGRG